jgi:hypothetical protein
MGKELTQLEIGVYQMISGKPGRTYRWYKRMWLSSSRLEEDPDYMYSDLFYNAFISLRSNGLVYEAPNPYTDGGSSAHPSVYPYSPADLVSNRLGK